MSFFSQSIFANLAGLAVWLTAGASAFAANDAGVMFKAYAAAFYVSDGTNAYFRDDQSGGAADFWRQAEEIECVIDAYEWTSNADYRVMAVDLLNGFETDHGTNWSANHFNDDCMWASIAFARGQLITGNARFGAIARWNFDLVYARAWDTNLNGGLYWTTDNHSKNACVNGPAGIAAHLLYQTCGEASYLDKARNIFAWERSVLFDADTGAVADNISLHGSLHSWASTYNQGTFIGLANFLGQTNDAKLAADFTRDELAEAGILPQYGIAGNNSGFNAIFFRWMTRFMRDRGLQGTYESWLQANAAAAWKMRRAADGLSWCQWRESTPPETNLHSWDCIASLEALQLVSPPGLASDTLSPKSTMPEARSDALKPAEK